VSLSLGAVDGYDVVTIEDLLELEQIRKQGEAYHLLHTTNIGVYGLYIKPCILALAQHLPTMSIVHEREGLDWDSYYVRTTWKRPIVRGSVTQADFRTLFSHGNHIVLVGRGFTSEELAFARSRGVEHVSAKYDLLRVSFRHNRFRDMNFSLITYLHEREVKMILDNGTWMKPMLFTSFGDGSYGRTVIVDFEQSNYIATWEPTATFFDPVSPAVTHLVQWWDRINEPTTLPGEALVIIGKKGSMKSTATKYVVEHFQRRITSNGAERLLLGRVDSDTYGRWLQAGCPKFRSWTEFSTFQDNEDQPSYFEIRINELIADWRKRYKGVRELKADRVYSKIYNEIEGLFSKECADLLDCKAHKPGYTLFSSTIYNLPDVPKGLIWEVHYFQEVCRIKALNIIQIIPPFDTRVCVANHALLPYAKRHCNQNLFNVEACKLLKNVTKHLQSYIFTVF
jgi:hypothetical protein